MQPSARSLEFTQVTEWETGKTRSHLDSLAAEEPLEIRIGDSPLSVTMRTPGHDRELAAGFLLTEGVIENATEIEDIHEHSSSDVKHNRISIVLRNREFRCEDHPRNFFAASGCGVCGKAAIESIRRRGLRAPDESFRISAHLLCGFPEATLRQQAVFERTGGLHAAALFDGEGRLIALREDIGRHNAVDKVIGWAVLNGKLPLSNYVLLVSGRGGFEIVQKALAAGVPALASVSAPSTLAVRLARELGMTLIGFLRGQRFVVYSGEHRILSSPMSQS